MVMKKTVLFFSTTNWGYKKVCQVMLLSEISYKVRKGWSHFVVVCDLSFDYSKLLGTGRIVALQYDYESKVASGISHIINTDRIETASTQHLIETESDLSWDMKFAVQLLSDLNIEDLYKLVRNSPIKRLSAVRSEELLSFYDCSHVVFNSGVPIDVKKIVLDIFTFHATSMHIIANVADERSGIIAEYSTVFQLAFVTRAISEKLMLLQSKLDIFLDFKKLDSSKKIKSVFKSQAVNSANKYTKELAIFVDTLDILDDNYRTPETHKMGKILGLICSGHYDTCMNEVLGFYNKAMEIFSGICNQI